MKKIILGLFTILSLSFGLQANVFASTNDFYFTDTTFDYYLSKTTDGSSTMAVKEVLTAVFPTTNQNHGIERCIPVRYRGVDSLDKNSFEVTRNGITEPFSTYKNEGELCYRIGSASSYVHGEQTYELSYTLNNVILNPDNSSLQELYWDTNGTGWAQPFASLTATVHLTSELASAFTGDTSCYVGKYGTKGTDATSRCYTLVSEDKSTITFTTYDLSARENLTLDLEFKSDSFVVPAKQPNYAPLILLAVLVIMFLFSIYAWISCYNSVKEKRELSKIQKPVQYTPMKGLTVAHAGQIWLKNTPALEVASLMELAVNHKIELERGEKKVFGGYKWKIHIKNLDDVTEEQRIVLEILNGGNSVEVDDIIEVKSHTATSHLQSLGRQFHSKPESFLRTNGYLEPKEHKNKASSRVGLLLFIYFMVAFGTLVFTFNLVDGDDTTYGQIGMVSGAAILSMFIHIIISTTVLANTSKFNKRTKKGIELSNYYDGLEEYMSLAEEDRIKFLHSVKTADVSHEGIVKLYEKLLPYAIMFNIEESWIAELNKYYKMDDVTEPDWVRGAAYLSTRDFHSFSTYTRSSVSSSTAIESSSSSGSSGGGGGGFSGGGGGGGGGGGW